MLGDDVTDAEIADAEAEAAEAEAEAEAVASAAEAAPPIPAPPIPAPPIPAPPAVQPAAWPRKPADSRTVEQRLALLEYILEVDRQARPDRDAVRLSHTIEETIRYEAKASERERRLATRVANALMRLSDRIRRIGSDRPKPSPQDKAFADALGTRFGSLG